VKEEDHRDGREGRGREKEGRGTGEMGLNFVQALGCASIIGNNFGLAILGYVFGKTLREVLNALQPAIQAHFIWQT
jgi:hypothetical protein